MINQQLGVQSIRLKTDFNALIEDLLGLGYIMNLTRNPFAVHERKGCYQNIKIFGSMGLVIAEDKKIDLRLFLSHWKHVYAVRETLKQGDRYSLQFFDECGTAIQKIFLQPESSLEYFESLLKQYANDDQLSDVSYVNSLPKKKHADPATIDNEQLRQAWQAMTDVHQFVHLLRKHNVDRQQAFKVVGDQFAQEFAANELERVLVVVAEIQLPIMCFVGNRASIQIFSGQINNVKRLGPWLNILDEEFNLHLMETGIDKAWLVRKPTVDGIITSLEFYDVDGNQVVQFFGKREEGQLENADWRQLAESVLHKNTANAAELTVAV